MQQGPEEQPSAAFRVSWSAPDGRATADAIDAPRVTEGCLIVKTSPTTVLWVPLGTIRGPIEIEGI